MDRDLVNAVAGLVYAFFGRVPEYGHDFTKDKDPDAQRALECAQAIVDLIETYNE